MTASAQLLDREAGAEPADPFKPIARARPGAQDGSAALRPILYLLFCALSLLPFLAVAHPPIVDFANHVARLSMACAISDPSVSAMYRYELGAIPNLAVDLVNLPLCGLAGPAAVLKLVIVGSLLTIYASGWLIQRRLFGRADALLLLLPAISLNLVTTMGYINYLAGIALCLAMVAAAIGREQRLGALLVIGNVGGVLLFFSHIFALAFAMLVFFGWLLRGRPYDPRRIAIAAGKTAAMFALPLLLLPLVASSGEGLSFSYSAKLRMLIAPVMSQSLRLDFVAFAMLLPLYLVVRNRLAFVHPTLRLPLALVAAFALLVPNQLQAAVDVDARTVVALAYLLIPALGLLSSDRRLTIGVTGVASALLAMHLFVTITAWLPFSREVASFRQQLDVLPARAAVLSVMSEKGDRRAALPLAYSHLASYATLDRRVFNPLEFTGIGMQPLSAHGRYAAIDTPAALPIPPGIVVKLKQPSERLRRLAESNVAFALSWQERFDYVVYYHFGTRPNFDPQSLTLLRQGEFFSILRVKREAPASARQSDRFPETS